MPQRRQQRVGRWGEGAAARFLEKQGYTILARNVHTPYGEIDLVGRQPGGTLVFVEVKSRTTLRYGNPEEAVDGRKLAHMASSAHAFVLAHPDLDAENWQIDVIAVHGRPGDNDEDVRFDHFENIAS